MNIVGQTKKIMGNAIKKYATDKKVDNTEVQFLISTDDTQTSLPKYQFLMKHKPIKEVSFNEILNVKVDFLGREMIASPFIANTIRRLAREKECSPLEISVLIYAKDSEVSEVLLCCFNKQNPEGFITFDYLCEGM